MKSILFVPADRPELVPKALKGPAAMICLDLEDGVAPSAKPDARRHLAASVEAIAAERPVAVRINADLDLISHDLDALPAGLAAIVLPKAAALNQLEQLSDALERKFGAARPRIIAMVESANGLVALENSTGGWPEAVTGLALGTEDFSADLGTTPDAPPVVAALNALAHLAARRRVDLLGYPGSIAAFNDLPCFKAAAQAGRAAGAVGGFAIHPKQVEVLNLVFGLSDKDRAEATRIVGAFETALGKGEGAIRLDGRMIDRPVYLAAKRRLASA